MQTLINSLTRNMMAKYIGKKYNSYYHGAFLWTVKIVDFMGDTGYFITEINDGETTWNSNASYMEIINEIKKGQYIEIA